MELVNSTPLAAKLVVSDVCQPERIGLITAKATYRFDARGATHLDTQNPFPLFAGDVETNLGLLPSDDLPRRDPAFEVILLGAAYSPGGKDVEQRLVALSVGDVRRELMVCGDRRWETSKKKKHISRTEPFTRMPLTYERAFGGKCDILVDKDAVMQVSDPNNPAGRGFDPAQAAAGIGEFLSAPEDYPQYDQTRLLPNVEDPQALIENWEDAPEPASWATLPMTSAIHALRSVKRPDEESAMVAELVVEEGVFHRAHPTWVIALPAREDPVQLEGLLPDGDVSFNLPPLRVLADYVVDGRRGTRELAPQMLVLLPEQRRFYIVYRHPFLVRFKPGAERSMRLRMEDGWYVPGDGGMA